MKLRIALCAINPNVGALAANAALILDAWRDARASGADVVVTLLHDKVDDAFLDAAGDQLRAVCNVAVGFDTWCEAHMRPWVADHVRMDTAMLDRWAGRDVDLTRRLPSDLVGKHVLEAGRPARLPGSQLGAHGADHEHVASGQVVVHNGLATVDRMDAVLGAELADDGAMARP